MESRSLPSGRDGAPPCTPLSLPRCPLAVRAAIAASLLAGAAGCGPGGGGGGGSSTTPENLYGSVSEVEVTDLGGLRFQVAFTLVAANERDLGIKLEFSEDQGASFSEATASAPSGTITTGATTMATMGGVPDPAPPSLAAASFTGSPAGVPHQVVWEAALDLSDLDQHDLVLRVSPYDLESGRSGTAASSAAFGVGANTAPVVSAVATPETVVGGDVAFTFSVADAESDHVVLEGEYSTDGGSTFRTATLDGEGAASVSTAPAAVEHTVVWHAQSDLPDVRDDTVRFRLRARDTEAGAFASTGTFTLQTTAPSIDLLTVNGVPAEMNGSTTYVTASGNDAPFTLLLPESGFVIWIEISTAEAGAAVDPAGIELRSSASIGQGAGGYEAGEDFGSLLVFADGVASLEVPPELSFPAGTYTLTARARDILGNTSAEASFTFETARSTAATRPFEDTDTWYLDFGRDNFTTTSTTDETGAVSISAALKPNGVADFVEDLRIIGLNSENPPIEAAGAGLNELVLESIKNAIAGYVSAYYGLDAAGEGGEGAVNIRFVLDPPAGSTSRIAIGGDDPIPGFTIGRAEFDYRNTFRNDDTDVDLGVFPTNLIEFYINSSFSFKSRFDPLIPGRGTPLGFHAADVTVLGAAFDRADPANSDVENRRYDEIAGAVDAIARVIATILAHEIGHSVGLVANGAPSRGLFGGEFNAAFAGPYTTTFHLDTDGNNIMAAAISFSGALQTGLDAPAFNELNMAYLREQLVVD